MLVSGEQLLLLCVSGGWLLFVFGEWPVIVSD